MSSTALSFTPTEYHLNYLHEKLKKGQSRSADGRYFIPIDAYNAWLNDSIAYSSILWMLNRNLKPALNSIPDNCRILLATLVLIDRLDIASRLISSQYTDNVLPLSQDNISSIDGTLSGTDFLSQQYQFLVPKLGPEIIASQWTTDYILPIVERSKLKQRAEGFGTVYKIKIHPSYDGFGSEDEVSSASA